MKIDTAKVPERKEESLLSPIFIKYAFICNVQYIPPTPTVIAIVVFPAFHKYYARGVVWSTISVFMHQMLEMVLKIEAILWHTMH